MTPFGLRTDGPYGTYVRAFHGEFPKLPTRIEIQRTPNTAPADEYVRDRWCWQSLEPGQLNRAQRRRARYERKLARRPKNNGYWT